MPSHLKEEDFMIVDEDAALSALLQRFSQHMRKRLDEKADQDFDGWMDETEEGMSHAELVKRIKENATEGHWADVANLAAFAHNLGYTGTPPRRSRA